MANTFHISIPDSMERFVNNRVSDKNFKSKGGYVQDLIRQDQLRTEKVQLTNLLLVGLASKHLPMNKNKWQDLKNKTMTDIENKQ
jgi:Arc/MetJ-type ribon-helix-helix transcriptional regulator